MRKAITVLSIVPVLLIFGGGLSAREARASNGIVGVEICMGCHEDRYKTYMLSTHSKKGIPGSPANQADCESCHGPGAAHVEKSGERGVGIFIFSKKIADAKSKSAKCLSCHGEGRDHAFWDMSGHKVADVSCDSCHTIHSGTRKNLKAEQPDLCNICHRSIRMQQNKISHHPIREGKLKCTNCHDPHGGFGPKMVKADSLNELCYQCHADKRGPYMWQHPPVEENCLTCHTPHGSNHAKLLQRKAPQLCQSCHDWTRHPGTIYTRFETFRGAATGSKNRMFARACLNCHSAIHGSNAPSLRGKTHVR